MAFVRRLFGALVAVLMMQVASAPAWAQSRPGPDATQHAFDELVNCYAQRRPECPTPTTSPTWTPTPMFTPTATATPTATPEPTTDTPVPLEPTSTPEPCWLVDQDLGDPDNDYVVFDSSGAPVPCPTAGPTDEPTAEPSATPSPTATPTGTPRPAQGPPAPQPPQVEVRTVIQTVVVVVTAPPSATWTPGPTRAPVVTRTPTWSPTPTRTTTVTPAATSTPIAAAPVVPTRGPVASSASRAPAPVSWDWGGFFRTIALVLVVIGVVALVLARRRVAVWGVPRPTPQPEDPHA